MALVLSKAAPLKPDILLAQALSEFKAILDGDAKAKLQRLCSNNGPPTTNDVMRLTAEIDRANCNQKRRQYFGPRLTNALQSVQQFSTVVDTIIGGADSAVASTIWGVVKLSLQIATNFSSFFDELSSLLMRIGRACPRYQEFGLLYLYSVRLQNALCRYYTVVIKLCKQVVLFTRKSFIAQIPSFLNSFASEFGRFGKDLDDLAVSVREEVSLASKQLQRDEADRSSHFRTIATKFFSDNAALERKRRRGEKAKYRLLDACSTYNYEIAWKQARKKGSTNWLFGKDEYKAWRSEQKISSALWCTGILGSGKTVLCANIVDDILLAFPTAIIAYFFCRHDEAVSLKARTIVGSIARQLLSGLNQPLPNGSALADAELADTSQILDLIKTLLPSDRQYFVLIDGIDECNDEEGVQLAQDLQRLISFKSLLHLYCSSRPDMFQRLSARFQVLCRARVAIPLTNPEIDLFIDAELEQRLETDKLCLGESSTIIAIRDALSKGAQGMFLWVSFQLETICTQSTDAAILSILDDLPKDLPETYNRHLAKLEYAKAFDPHLCKKAFQILTAAQRPLTLEELRHAVSVVPGTTTWDSKMWVNDISRTINGCGSLLIIDEEESTVQFAHHSIKQHLLSRPTASTTVSNYHVNIKEADVRLGEICVTYLNLDSMPLQKPNSNPQIWPINIPLAISLSSSTHSKLVNRVAIQLLKGSQPSTYDLQHQLQKVGNTLQESGNGQALAFFSYARDHWLYHSRDFEKPSVSNDKCLSLWAHLVKGAPGLVLPWTPENASELGPRLLHWIVRNQHGALLYEVIDNDIRFHAVNVMYENGVAGRIIDFLRNCINSLKVQSRFFGCALQLVSRFGHDDIRLVRLLLDKGVNPHEHTPMFGSALKAACEGGNEKTARLLLEIGVDVDATDGAALWVLPNKEKDFYSELDIYYFGTALTVAARKGFCKIIELLLEYGAAINLPNSNNETPLFVAAQAGKKGAVKLLVDNGADVDLHMAGKGKDTALTIAMERYEAHQHLQEDLILPLLYAAADLDKHVCHYYCRDRSTTYRRSTAYHQPTTYQVSGSLLHKACASQFGAVVELLIEKGANTKARDSDGATPLHRAVDVRFPSLEIVKLLLDHGADVNATELDGFAVIHTHVGSGTYYPFPKEVLSFLIKRGANVNIRTRSGASPLHMSLRLAFLGGVHCFPVVEYLLEHGADVNARDENEVTPLHIAVDERFNFLPVVQLLLENGADLEARNKVGKTPYEFLNSKDGEFVRFLAEWTNAHGHTPFVKPGGLASRWLERRNSR